MHVQSKIDHFRRMLAAAECELERAARAKDSCEANKWFVKRETCLRCLDALYLELPGADDKCPDCDSAGGCRDNCPANL